MPDISNPVPIDLPSTRTLIRSTLTALVIAGVLLLTVVLPAEYGVDPTGMGAVLGLTRMGEIKVSLASEVDRAAPVATSEEAPTPPADEAAAGTTASSPVVPAPPPGPAAPRVDTTTFTLEPNQGREIKLLMREGARVTYSWSTDRGVVNYDQHADSKEPPRGYHGYRKGSGVASDEGELVAAFDGRHGWFWRNRGRERVTLTLRTSGGYQDITGVN